MIKKQFRKRISEILKNNKSKDGISDHKQILKKLNSHDLELELFERELNKHDNKIEGGIHDLLLAISKLKEWHNALPDEEQN